MNKWVLRLAANIPFIRQNLCPPSFIDVPQQALNDVVAAIVRNDESATVEVIQARTPIAVNEEDKEHFIQLALAEFKTLHQGNVVRFGIRPLEFSAWQSRHTNPA